MDILIPNNLENATKKSLFAIEGLLGASGHHKMVFADLIKFISDTTKDLEIIESHNIQVSNVNNDSTNPTFLLAQGFSESSDTKSLPEDITASIALNYFSTQTSKANNDLINPAFLQGHEFNESSDRKSRPDKINENKELNNFYQEEAYPHLTEPIALNKTENTDLGSREPDKMSEQIQQGTFLIYVNEEKDSKLFRKDGLMKSFEPITKIPIRDKEVFLDQASLSYKNEMGHYKISEHVLELTNKRNESNVAIAQNGEKIMDQRHIKNENLISLSFIRKLGNSNYFVGDIEQEIIDVKYVLKVANPKIDNNHTSSNQGDFIFNDISDTRIIKQQEINTQSYKLELNFKEISELASTQIKDTEYPQKPSDGLRTNNHNIALHLEGMNKNIVEGPRIALQDITLPKETLKTFENLFVTTKNNSSSINISLNTNDIGILDIELVLEKGVINGHINTTDNIGKELIERNLYRIIDSLTREGLNIGGFSVSLRHKGEGFSENRGNQEIIKRDNLIRDIDSPAYYLKQGIINIFV